MEALVRLQILSTVPDHRFFVQPLHDHRSPDSYLRTALLLRAQHVALLGAVPSSIAAPVRKLIHAVLHRQHLSTPPTYNRCSMTDIASGKSVGRRLNELQDALDIPPLPVSTMTAHSSPSNNYSPTEESFEDASEDLPASFSTVGLGLDDVDNTGRTTPTMSTLPTSTAHNATSQSTSATSPRPTNLTLDPGFESLPPPDPEEATPNADRYSVATTSSTPDMDRFSTVQLKTPTADFSTDTPFTGRIDVFNNAGVGSSVPNLHDDEEDLGSTRLVQYEQRPRSIGGDRADVKLQTNISPSNEDVLRTPIAATNGLPHLPVSPGGSSTKPLAEGVDLLIARIEKDKANPSTNRRSLEGREQLKEDFERLKLSSPTTATGFPQSPRKLGANGPGGGAEEKVDWGMFR